MNCFRGIEPDSGTAFELGYAYAVGKKLYCCLWDIRTLRGKIGETDAAGMMVEDFGFPFNLMISVPTSIVQVNFEDCIKRIDLTKIIKYRSDFFEHMADDGNNSSIDYVFCILFGNRNSIFISK